MARKSTSKTSVKVDLSDVGTSALVPEGDHPFKVLEVVRKTGQDSGQPYLVWKVQVTDCAGSPIYENTSLQPQSLFALRGMLEACDYEIPDEAFSLDLKELEDLEFAGTVFHEIYEGKKKAKLATVFQLDELDGVETDEEADEEDDPETDTEDGYDEMSKVQLKAECKERGLKGYKSLGEDELRDLLREDDGDDPEEEDAEEEDEDAEEIDLDSMDLKELKALAAEYSDDINLKSIKKAAGDSSKKFKRLLKAELEELLSDDGDDGEDDD